MTIETIVSADETRGRTDKPFVRRLLTAGRLLMGAILFAAGAFGLLTLLHLVPPPASPMPAQAATFAGALAKTTYMMPLVSGTQFIAGALLLSNRFVPLALALAAPLVVNILAFHAFLAPAGAGPGLVLAALELYLAWSYREAYGPMLAARTTPTR